MLEKITIEGEAKTSGFAVQVGSYEWAQPMEMMEENSIPSITLLLSPPHSFSEGYFSLSRQGGRFADCGDLIFAPANAHLHVRASGGPIRLIRCFFEPDFVNETSGLEWQWNDQTLQGCVNIKSCHLKQALVRLSQEILHPGPASGRLTEILGELVAIEVGRHFQAIGEHSTTHAQQLTPWQVKRINRYLEDLETARADMIELARCCGISSRHLRRLFKETTNQTIHEYIRDVWTAKAKNLLSDTQLPVKEIAARFGFSDAANFSMAFRRATGQPPTAFRQQFNRPRIH